MQTPEPLSNDEILARLDGILKMVDELKQSIKEIKLDADGVGNSNRTTVE